MKTLKYLSISAAILLMASCGGKKESAEADDMDNTEMTDDVEDAGIVEESEIEIPSLNSGAPAEKEESTSSVKEEAPAAKEDAEVSAADQAKISDLLSQYKELYAELKGVIEKAQNGDASAIASASSLMTKSQKIYKDLQSYTGKMTAEQTAELAKLAQEFSQSIDLDGLKEKAKDKVVDKVKEKAAEKLNGLFK